MNELIIKLVTGGALLAVAAIGLKAAWEWIKAASRASLNLEVSAQKKVVDKKVLESEQAVAEIKPVREDYEKAINNYNKSKSTKSEQ
ncbi:MAG: hypothetical protein FMNOHCHN_03757 [Ignavibacteriaceae bacterium]|nr:hypothetical protein [Ignavibacteriaceae bacterium]